MVDAGTNSVTGILICTGCAHVSARQSAVCGEGVSRRSQVARAGQQELALCLTRPPKLSPSSVDRALRSASRAARVHGPGRLSNAQKLRLYGLFKMATSGCALSLAGVNRKTSRHGYDIHEMTPHATTTRFAGGFVCRRRGISSQLDRRASDSRRPRCCHGTSGRVPTCVPMCIYSGCAAQHTRGAVRTGTVATSKLAVYRSGRLLEQACLLCYCPLTGESSKGEKGNPKMGIWP